MYSYEETFISGALLHYPSKHPVSSQFPDFCKKKQKMEKNGEKVANPAAKGRETVNHILET